jgi:aconitate hydratase
VLPLVFRDGEDADTHGLTGEEIFDITGIALGITPKQLLDVRALAPNGTTKTFQVFCRVDTPNEVSYIRNGGILQYVLRKMVKA